MSETWGEAAERLESDIQENIDVLYQDWIVTGDEESRQVILRYLALLDKLDTTRTQILESVVEAWNKSAR